jgi:hypothetical protein
MCNSLNIFHQSIWGLQHKIDELASMLQTKKQMNQNPWITPGIITSCKHKKELYIKLQYSNNPITTLYYKKYSKILAAVIKKSKRIDYDKLILNLYNKIKTTWNIINTEYGRMENRNETLALNVNGMKIIDQ